MIIHQSSGWVQWWIIWIVHSPYTQYIQLSRMKVLLKLHCHIVEVNRIYLDKEHGLGWTKCLVKLYPFLKPIPRFICIWCTVNPLGPTGGRKRCSLLLIGCILPSIHYRLLMYKLLFIMTPRFPYCNYHEYTRWLMHILADQSPETYAMITRGVHWFCEIWLQGHFCYRHHTPNAYGQMTRANIVG